MSKHADIHTHRDIGNLTDPHLLALLNETDEVGYPMYQERDSFIRLLDNVQLRLNYLKHKAENKENG